MRSFIHHTTFGSMSKIWQGIIASRKDNNMNGWKWRSLERSWREGDGDDNMMNG